MLASLTVYAPNTIFYIYPSCSLRVFLPMDAVFRLRRAVFSFSFRAHIFFKTSYFLSSLNIPSSFPPLACFIFSSTLLALLYVLFLYFLVCLPSFCSCFLFSLFLFQQIFPHLYHFASSFAFSPLSCYLPYTVSSLLNLSKIFLPPIMCGRGQSNAMFWPLATKAWQCLSPTD